MKDFFRKILGKKYLLNMSTGEVHKIKSINGACGVDKMANHNKKYLTEKQYKKLLDDDINGCVHCLKETNTDKY
jgi:hypothetical protein